MGMDSLPGRNDPCPCGSGKKYKKCCLGKKTFMESLGTPNAATEMLNRLTSQLGDKPRSLEELNSLASQFMARESQAPIDDFLGLSSDQMHNLLYSECFSPRDILSLRNDVDPDLLVPVPVIRQALYLLEELGKSEKGVKATATAKLPRVLVQAFSREFSGEEGLDFKPMGQADLPGMDLLVYALKETGLIKIRTGWFSLTKKGQEIGEGKKLLSLYTLLFSFYANSYDWLSMTYYDEEFFIIQQAASFGLFLLKKKARVYVPQAKIAALFQKAFPQTGEMARPFLFLFLESFCLPFGLVERNRDLAVRQSELFKRLFDWRA